MAFQVSPGVNVSEIDLTTVVPAVATSTGAVAGVFKWGPLDERTLVSSEIGLVDRFGKPTNHNPETFFTAANFLAYGNALYVARAGNTTPTSAYTSCTTADSNAQIIAVSTASLAVGMKVAGLSTVPDGTLITAITNSTLFTVATAANGIASSTNTYFYSANSVLSAIATSDSSNSIVVSNFATTTTVKNDTHYGTMTFSDSDLYYIARHPGEFGNSLKISVCDSANAYLRNLSITNSDANLASGSLAATIGSTTVTVSVANSSTGTLAEANTRMAALLSSIEVGDNLELGNTSIGKQYVRVLSVPATMGTNSEFANTTHRYFSVTVDSAYQLAADFSGSNVVAYWEYFNTVDVAPGTSDYQTSFGNTSAVDEMHIVVADEDGLFTGVPGSILEVYKGVSRATNAKTTDGATNYYVNVINDSSKYVRWANHRAGVASNTASNLASVDTVPLYASFHNGQDGDAEDAIPLGRVLAAYDLFASTDDVDVALVMTGKSRGGTNGEQIANYLVDNIAEVRKDCIVLASPEKADVVNNNNLDEASDTVTFRNSLRSSSYLVIDSGYKYQYDKYNDVFRYVPLNGDIAGLCVRTDATRDPWFSPAGFNRGQIKNLVKLAYNPDKADRDLLYKNGINPVATFPGQGTVLFGDKTALSKPSAFDRINVRRLFIVLEKAIATAAKFSLFEFNDEFTRAQFVSLVEPFLRDVQGRRGIYDYRVVCDNTNNTGEVVDRNEFVGDIYIKPAKSINFIQLNFVAVRTGVAFDEIVGKF
jgi:phage tail sheath protein FI